MAWKHAVSVTLVLFLLAGYFGHRDFVHALKSADPIQEEYGARVAPYKGFLKLPATLYPEGYKEESHHFTKTEYLLRISKQIGRKSFSIDIIESSIATFFPPETGYIATFVYRGAKARLYKYQDPKTRDQSIDLYWMNPPKQRLSISADQVPSQEWTPERLMGLLEKMTIATGEPALEQSDQRH